MLHLEKASDGHYNVPDDPTLIAPMGFGGPYDSEARARAGQAADADQLREMNGLPVSYPGPPEKATTDL